MGRVTLQELTDQVLDGISLQTDDAEAAAHLMVSASVPAAQKEAFLTALADKGETPDEVAGFARSFRALALDPGLGDIAEHAVDLVGTGGDGIGSFNISTAASFVVATAGVPVLKHGNRSITSKCGSADILEGVGIDLMADRDTLERSVREVGYGFLFAPAFHPVFKEVMPVRQAMAAKGRRSIFNILGPLINPARPAYQLLGVFARSWVKPMAGALGTLGLRRAVVVHCTLPDGRGMDELCCAGENTVAVLDNGEVQTHNWSLASLGLEPCTLEDLKGGDREENLRLLADLVNGRANRGLTQTVSLNAGAALWAAQKVDSVKDGVQLAQDLLNDGSVRNWLEQLRAFYNQSV